MEILKNSVPRHLFMVKKNGVAVDADETPEGVVYLNGEPCLPYEANGVDVPWVPVTIEKPVGAGPGVYRARWSMLDYESRPNGDYFVVGRDRIQLQVTAVIEGKEYSSFVFEARIEPEPYGPSRFEVLNAFEEIKGATFDTLTDSLEAIRDRGDSAWTAGTSLTATDVWTHPDRTLSSGANLNDLSTADIDARLAAYDAPTKAELDAAFSEIKGATFVGATDSLEALRNRGDAAWTTAVGFATTGDLAATQAAIINQGDAEWITADVSALATAASITALNDLSTADVDARLAAYDGPTKAELDAAFTEIKGATFDTLTDSLEAIRDRGDAAWTGGSSLTATDVWTHEDRTLSSGANLNDLSTADIDARLAAYDGPTHAELVAAFTEIKGATWSSLTDTLEALRDRGDSAWVTADVSALASQASITALNDLSTADIDARLAAYGAPTKAELDAAQAAIIAQGDAAWATADVSALATAASIAALNNLSTADIDARLAAYDGPTHAEIVAAFTEIKGATWNSATDSLESIRDRGDEAWATAVGVTEAEVWSYFTGIDGDVARTAIAVAVDARLKQTTQHAS